MQVLELRPYMEVLACLAFPSPRTVRKQMDASVLYAEPTFFQLPWLFARTGLVLGTPGEIYENKPWSAPLPIMHHAIRCPAQSPPSLLLRSTFFHTCG